MNRVIRALGSLQMAVPLLVAIATVLAWGTMYETRFGTAAVQRTVYQSWWFQALLGFLAVNLAVAAFERYPWKRAHAPFVLAHLGIIAILLGGIIGGRFGIEGQLIIPEGEAEKLLQLPTNVLTVHHHASETTEAFRTDFETRAWVHAPNRTWVVPIASEVLQLTVDRYYPDAQLTEEIAGDGTQARPAVQVRLRHEQSDDTVWLFADDPERFGIGWGEGHVLFLAPTTQAQLDQLFGRASDRESPRGIVTVRLPHLPGNHEIAIPERLGQPMQIGGTPYTITFKDYFPDFELTSHGLASRSEEPKNPAVSFLLSGPEGADAHLLFARHPDFAALHGRVQVISAEVAYTHAAVNTLAPNAIALVQVERELKAVLTDEALQRTVIESLGIGARHTHPTLGYAFEVVTHHPKARLIQHITNRSDEVRAEAVHVIGRLGGRTAEAWVWLRQAVELTLGEERIAIEYRPAQRELPVTIKLSDFRKITYPGSPMAAGFESDVQLTDSRRGLVLMRKIRMNHPLRYRGYSFFQSSFVEGPVETTVLSVRNDPGTPLVYAGFLIVITGVVTMFVMRSRAGRSASRARRNRMPR